MPGSLDSCINSVYEDGNIPASAGIPPVRVLLKDALEAAVSEAAAALDSTDFIAGYLVAVSETAAALDVTDAAVAAMMSAMLAGPNPVFVNSDTSRQAMVDGIMVNL